MLVAVAEFKGSAARHGTVVGTVRFVGLAAGPPDSGDDGPWVHADVTIDGLVADTDYCAEVHEFGNLRCVCGTTMRPLDPRCLSVMAPR